MSLGGATRHGCAGRDAAARTVYGEDPPEGSAKRHKASATLSSLTPLYYTIRYLSLHAGNRRLILPSWSTM